MFCVISRKIFSVQDLVSLTTMLLQNFHRWRSSADCLTWYISWNYLLSFLKLPSEPYLCHFHLCFCITRNLTFWCPFYRLSSLFSVAVWAVGAWARMRDWLAVHIKRNCARYTNIRFSSSSAVLCLLVGDICSWGHCWSICLYRQESGK